MRCRQHLDVLKLKIRGESADLGVTATQPSRDSCLKCCVRLLACPPPHDTERDTKETHTSRGSEATKVKRNVVSRIPERPWLRRDDRAAPSPRASLQVPVPLALDRLLDAEQHGREPLVQPRDRVEFFHGLGVRLGVLLLVRFQQFFQ